MFEHRNKFMRALVTFFYQKIKLKCKDFIKTCNMESKLMFSFDRDQIRYIFCILGFSNEN